MGVAVGGAYICVYVYTCLYVCISCLLYEAMNRDKWSVDQSVNWYRQQPVSLSDMFTNLSSILKGMLLKGFVKSLTLKFWYTYPV